MVAAFALAVAVVLAPAAASPSPSPSASPRASPTPLKEIGRISTIGRKANLVGKAQAASEGTIDQEQIATRPLLRPADVLEAIPGLVITQHSGGGKANQYYLRGFQLDHGTDLESTVAGTPINLPTHAHGQGYSDINWVIPELVSYVEFKKGPYYADRGDFSTAGSYNLYYRTSIAPIMELAGGSYGYGRYLTAGSQRLGSGTLLYGLELMHDNSSFERPDEYSKYNGVLRYSLTKGANDFSATGMAYNGPFNSTDQIPQRLVTPGIISRFGYIDPSDGGNTYRYSLDLQFQHRDPNGYSKFNAYGFVSFLDLFSNFTYFLDDATDYYNVTRNPVTCNPAYVSCLPNVPAHHTSTYSPYCPAYNTAPSQAGYHTVVVPAYTFACGDQREQLDKRFVSGFDVARSFEAPHAQTTFGFGTRSDNIPEIGLFLTNDRNRYPDGTLSDDHVVERSFYAFAQTQLRVGPRIRLSPGLRFDAYNFHVAAFDPANSGNSSAALIDPKLDLAYTLSRTSELYADFGESYHSNDARGITGVDDPVTHRPFDATGASVDQTTPLVRASGTEFGYRYSTPRLTTTVSAFQLLLQSELVFDGDHGTTEASGPTVRRGIEVANFWSPVSGLTYDADVATTTARFLTDPDHQGTGVPESLNAVIAAGVTFDKPHYAASLRLRYFGPRALDTQGDAYSNPSTLLSTQFTAKLRNNVRLTLDCFNLLNADVDDVRYYYASWLPHDAASAALAANPAINPALGGAGISDFHFHPTEKRAIRLSLATRL